jgi:hypothetical protein
MLLLTSEKLFVKSFQIPQLRCMVTLPSFCETGFSFVEMEQVKWVCGGMKLVI